VRVGTGPINRRWARSIRPLRRFGGEWNWAVGAMNRPLRGFGGGGNWGGGHDDGVHLHYWPIR
jgi:hypothetical protein